MPMSQAEGWLKIFFGCVLQHVGSSFPNQGSNLSLEQWENSVSTTGLPGTPLSGDFIGVYTCKIHPAVNLRLANFRTTVGYHFYYHHNEGKNKTDNSECWWGWGGAAPHARLLGLESFLKKDVAVLHKDKHGITIWLVILLLGIWPRELKMYVHPRVCAWMFIAALFVIAKKVVTTHMFISWQIDKQGVVYLQNEFFKDKKE